MLINLGLTSFLKKTFEASLDRLLDRRILDFIKHATVFLALGGFLLTLILVYLKKGGYLQGDQISDSYFSSIYVAFSMILFYEVISMIYGLPRSIAHSIGKQYEVMSLVIIRHVFEKAGQYNRIKDLFQDSRLVLDMTFTVLGTMLVFFLIGYYSRIQTHASINSPKERLRVFVFMKKLLAAGLFLVIFSMGILEFLNFLIYATTGAMDHAHHHFGHDFYADLFTLMIFVDILLVLLTMQYGGHYPLVYRNTGLMISTVILRFSFTANILTGVYLMSLAVLIGILSSLIYNYFQGIQSLDRLSRRESSLYADPMIVTETGGFVSIRRSSEYSSDLHFPVGSGRTEKPAPKRSRKKS